MHHMKCNDGVSGTDIVRAWFYVRLHTPVYARNKDNQRLLMIIRDSYSLSEVVYGNRPVVDTPLFHANFTRDVEDGRSASKTIGY